MEDEKKPQNNGDSTQQFSRADGIEINSREVGNSRNYNELERLEGKLVIANSRRDGIRIIGRLRKVYVIEEGRTFVKRQGDSEAGIIAGRHMIIDENYRRNSKATYWIKDQEELDTRQLCYLLDEQKAAEIETYLQELAKFPDNLPLNREDNI